LIRKPAPEGPENVPVAAFRCHGRGSRPSGRWRNFASVAAAFWTGAAVTAAMALVAWVFVRRRPA
jgi:hypothetical protein